MPKDFVIKLKKYLKEYNAIADGNICKDCSNSAKHVKLQAMTPDMKEEYHKHLMENAV